MGSFVGCTIPGIKLINLTADTSPRPLLKEREANKQILFPNKNADAFIYLWNTFIKNEMYLKQMLNNVAQRSY